MTVTSNPPAAPVTRPQFGAQRNWAPEIVVLIVALIACAWWIVGLHGEKPAEKTDLHYPFIAVAVVLTGFCALAGYLTKDGRIDGILIDDRNRVSLSRLQWVAWLIVLQPRQ